MTDAGKKRGRVFAIGDIQGCFDAMRRALDEAGFDAARDELWCVGDLVNRGPDSLGVLRFLRDLGDRCHAVLGNHDLHLLARAAGGRSYRGDTLDALLDAPDAAELIEWLRHRPMLHRDARLGWMMVHAGLAPAWSLAVAQRRARRVEKALRGRNWRKFCLRLESRDWPAREPHGPKGKLDFAVAVLTRARWCAADGRMDWKARASGPEDASRAWFPWFAHPQARWRRSLQKKKARKKALRVLFGHWAARGLVLDQPDVLGLDSGCVWGGKMTVARLKKGGDFSIAASCDCEGWQPLGL